MRNALPALMLFVGACTVHELDATPEQGMGQPPATQTQDAHVVQLPSAERDSSVMPSAMPNAAADAAHASMDAARPSSLDAAATLDARASETAAPEIDAGEWIELSDLAIYNAPSGAARKGVWGYDARRGLCISTIWVIDGPETRYCDDIFARIPPYVVIEAMPDPGSTSDPKWISQDAPCWAYGPNATLRAQRGCADFGKLSDEGDDRIEIELDVESEAFTGTLHLVHE